MNVTRFHLFPLIDPMLYRRLLPLSGSNVNKRCVCKEGPVYNTFIPKNEPTSGRPKIVRK